MYDAMVARQVLMAQLLGFFGVFLIGAGLLMSADWISHSGIIFSVLGFVLFFVLKF